jgi:hypothetical protein
VAQGLGVEDRVLRDELRRAARERRREIGPGAVTGFLTGGRRRRLTEAEGILLRFLAESAPRFAIETDEIVAAVPREALGAGARPLVERWVAARREGQWLTLRQLAELAPADATADIFSLAFAPGAPPEAAEAWSAASALRETDLESRVAVLQERIASAEKAGDRAAFEQLTREKLAIRHEIQDLARGVPTRGAARGQAPLGGQS